MQRKGWFEVRPDQDGIQVAVFVFSEYQDSDDYWGDIVIRLRADDCVEGPYQITHVDIGSPTIQEHICVAAKILNEVCADDPDHLPEILDKLGKFLFQGNPKQKDPALAR